MYEKEFRKFYVGLQRKERIFCEKYVRELGKDADNRVYKLG